MQLHWRMLIIMCILGLIVICFLGYGFYNGVRINAKYYPLLDAVMEMRFDATTDYLWFKEFLGRRQ